MATFTIKYLDGTTEDVEASTYTDTDQWIDFIEYGGMGGSNQVLRVRSEMVDRIDRRSD